MKRYLLFIGRNYYPLPGMGDFINDFDTLEEAKRINEYKEVAGGFLDWVQIYDQEERKTVWEETVYDTLNPKNHD